ncbi:hypothetical protein [Saccharopolyspora sp. NPDC049357]|uniref:hypothetical protein n=1 Tax=Saccharopolyspora sp. NPDC049357 TaxID=3154507 RepID=UPI003414EF2E
MISIDPNALVRALNSMQKVDHSGEVVFCTPKTGMRIRCHRDHPRHRRHFEIAGRDRTATRENPRNAGSAANHDDLPRTPEAGRPAHHTNAQLAMKASTARERTAS